jgi:hypothetical protein
MLVVSKTSESLGIEADPCFTLNGQCQSSWVYACLVVGRSAHNIFQYGNEFIKSYGKSNIYNQESKPFFMLSSGDSNLKIKFPKKNNACYHGGFLYNREKYTEIPCSSKSTETL